MNCGMKKEGLALRFTFVHIHFPLTEPEECMDFTPLVGAGILVLVVLVLRSSNDVRSRLQNGHTYARIRRRHSRQCGQRVQVLNVQDEQGNIIVGKSRYHIPAVFTFHPHKRGSARFQQVPHDKWPGWVRVLYAELRHDRVSSREEQVVSI